MALVSHGLLDGRVLLDGVSFRAGEGLGEGLTAALPAVVDAARVSRRVWR
jgi:hypothetical protein